MPPSDTHPSTETRAHRPAVPTPKGMRRRDAYLEHLDDRLRSLRDALRAARQGDFSVRIPTDEGDQSVLGEVASAFNALAEQNDALVKELARIHQVAGVQGRTTERSSMVTATGAWGVAL